MSVHSVAMSPSSSAFLGVGFRRLGADATFWFGGCAMCAPLAATLPFCNAVLVAILG